MLDTVIPESLGFEEKIKLKLETRKRWLKAIYHNPLKIQFTHKIIEDIWVLSFCYRRVCSSLYFSLLSLWKITRS